MKKCTLYAKGQSVWRGSLWDEEELGMRKFAEKGKEYAVEMDGKNKNKYKDICRKRQSIWRRTEWKNGKGAKMPEKAVAEEEASKWCKFTECGMRRKETVYFSRNRKEDCGMRKYMRNRVQWFWHFFRNSICFMCFWFGLEILRLVYKKVFFEILNGFYLIWPFILRKKQHRPVKELKKNSSKLGVQGIKRSGILRWFQNCAEVSSLAKGKKIYRKTEFFGNWKILQKIVFLIKNLWELLDARVLHNFEISAKSRFFWYPARPNSKKFFFNSYKGRCCFFQRIKAQIR